MNNSNNIQYLLFKLILIHSHPLMKPVVDIAFIMVAHLCILSPVHFYFMFYHINSSVTHSLEFKLHLCFSFHFHIIKWAEFMLLYTIVFIYFLPAYVHLRISLCIVLHLLALGFCFVFSPFIYSLQLGCKTQLFSL